jgi:hypothetical protein
MSTESWVFLWTVICSFGVPTGIALYIKKLFKQDGVRRKKREVALDEFYELQVRGIKQSIDLGKAVAIAMQNGKCNGEVADALRGCKKLEEDQDKFLATDFIQNRTKSLP